MQKQVTIAIFSIVTLCSCNQNNMESRTSSDSLKTSHENMKATRKDTAVENSDPGADAVVAFRLKTEKGQAKIFMDKQEITLYRASGKDAFQTVGFSDSDMDFSTDYYKEDPSRILEFEDLNFDGNQDLKIKANEGSGGIWYSVYLFDNATGLYVKNEKLSEMTSLSADSIAKTVSLYDIAGWAGAAYVNKTFIWKGNELLLIRNESQELVDESGEELVKEIQRINEAGEMKTVMQVNIKTAEDKEIYCLTEGDWKELDSDERFKKGLQNGTIVKRCD